MNINELIYLGIHLESIPLCMAFITVISNTSRKITHINSAPSIYAGKYLIAFCLLLIQETHSFSKYKLLRLNQMTQLSRSSHAAWPSLTAPDRCPVVQSTPPLNLSCCTKLNVFPSFPESPYLLPPVRLCKYSCVLWGSQITYWPMNQPSKITHNMWYMCAYFSGDHTHSFHYILKGPMTLSSKRMEMVSHCHRYCPMVYLQQ